MYATSISDSDQSQREILDIHLPNNWWNVSYSYSFFAEEDNAVKIIPFRTKSNKVFNNQKKDDFSKTLGYDLSKGDYHVQETYSSKNDFTHNQQIKAKIIKYSVYPVVVFSLILTFTILHGLAELPF